MKTKCMIILILSLLIFNTQILSQEKFVSNVKSVTAEKIYPIKQERTGNIEENIYTLMKKTSIPGLSIVVIKDGEIDYSKGFGVKNADTKESADENTVYEACSLSKPVFAFAVLKMVEKGIIDLDKPLMSYVTDEYIEKNFLRNKIEDERIRNITTRNVLTHTPGFPNWRGNSKLNINFSPGEKFSYSGEGYVFLQKVVEFILEKSLNEIMTEYVFKPLNMENSSYVWLDKFDELFAAKHNFLGGATGKFKPRTANAAASLHTTAVDYARFIGAIINNKGLSKETISSVLNPQTKVNSKITENVYWGLGWGIETGTSKYFWHWGDNGDFKCFVMASEEKKNGVIYFTNSSNGLSIAEEIVKLTLGGEHPAFSTNLLTDYPRFDSPIFAFAEILKNDGVDEAISKFREFIKKEPAEKSILPENNLNMLGYFYLRSNKIDDAIKLFKFNVDIYPESSNVYDSLGEAYMKKGDNELAIKNYEKSIELNPDNTDGIEMLKRLKEK
ncbi:serine hydrolase [candidate division KSB1 bacterium]